jgi:hypothetical protein
VPATRAGGCAACCAACCAETALPFREVPRSAFLLRLRLPPSCRGFRQMGFSKSIVNGSSSRGSPTQHRALDNAARKGGAVSAQQAAKPLLSPNVETPGHARRACPDTLPITNGRLSVSLCVKPALSHASDYTGTAIHVCDWGVVALTFVLY